MIIQKTRLTPMTSTAEMLTNIGNTYLMMRNMMQSLVAVRMVITVKSFLRTVH